MCRKTSDQQKEYEDKLWQVSRQNEAGISYQAHYLTTTRCDPLPTYSNLAEAGTKTGRSTLIMEIRQKKLSQKEHIQTAVAPSVLTAPCQRSQEKQLCPRVITHRCKYLQKHWSSWRVSLAIWKISSSRKSSMKWPHTSSEHRAIRACRSLSKAHLVPNKTNQDSAEVKTSSKCQFNWLRCKEGSPWHLGNPRESKLQHAAHCTYLNSLAEVSLAPSFITSSINSVPSNWLNCFINSSLSCFCLEGQRKDLHEWKNLHWQTCCLVTQAKHAVSNS